MLEGEHVTASMIKDVLISLLNICLLIIVMCSECWVKVGDKCYSPVYDPMGHYNMAWMTMMDSILSIMLSLIMFLEVVCVRNNALRRRMLNGVICMSNVIPWLLTLFVAEMESSKHMGGAFIISVVWSCVLFVAFVMEFAITVYRKKQLLCPDDVTVST